MAQVKWQGRAERELYKILVKGFSEFGETVANAFSEKVSLQNETLCKFPEIGYPEPLLKDRKRLYRARHIIKRFKMIYYFDVASNVVHVVDIWDTRREPSKLVKRIKK